MFNRPKLLETVATGRAKQERLAYAGLEGFFADVLNDMAGDKTLNLAIRDWRVVQWLKKRLFNPKPGTPNLPDAINAVNRNAYRAGVNDSAKTGGNPAQPLTVPPVNAVNPQQAVSQLLKRMSELEDAGKPISLADVRATFDVSGFTSLNPYQLRTLTDTAVGTAYQSGLVRGWRQSPDVTGFYYDATLDLRTTAICLTYNGTQLLKDDPWWNGHTPCNHWQCRSCLLPLTGDFEPTENPPMSPPPAPGFGNLYLSRTARRILAL